MPIYEFKCPECAHVWEDLQSMKLDSHTSACPKCGLPKVKSMITGGTGFNFVDHKTGNPVPGFPTNDSKVEKVRQADIASINAVLPEGSPADVERAARKLKNNKRSF